MTTRETRNAVRAVTDAHARAMSQLAEDLMAPNPMFDAVQNLPEERGMFDRSRGIYEVMQDHTNPDGTRTTTYSHFVHLRNGNGSVDLAPFNGQEPTPEEFMAWAHHVSGIPRADEQPITYARVGETAGVHSMRVIDLDTGNEVPDVIEIDVVDGWLRRMRRDENGQYLVFAQEPEPGIERVEGRFRVERTDQHGRLPAHDRDELIYRRMHLVAEVLNLGSVSFVAAATRLIMDMPEVFLMSHLSVCEGAEYDGYITLTWQTIGEEVVLVMDDDVMPSLHTPHGMKDVHDDNIWVELAEALGMTLGAGDLPDVPVRRQAPTGQRALDLA